MSTINTDDKQPKVAVIIPCYNGATFLRPAIDSALNQTHPNVEVVVVDDGSTDQSPEVLSEYSDRITVIRQENRGLSAARNKGITYCRADYYFLLDSDDIAVPTCIEDRLALAMAHPEIGIVTGNSVVIDENGVTAEGRTTSPFTSEIFVPEERAWSYTWSPPSGWLIPQNTFDTVGYFDPLMRRSEDLDFQFRVLRKFRLGYCRSVGILYRVSQNQMSNQSGTAFEKTRKAAMQSRIRHMSFGDQPLVEIRRTLRCFFILHKFAVIQIIEQKKGAERLAMISSYCFRHPAALPSAAKHALVKTLRSRGVKFKLRDLLKRLNRPDETNPLTKS